MNFKPRRKEDIDINLTPLIDVVFLLLIFFMVTTTFNRFSELRIDLPQASQEPVQAQKKQLELVIDARGRYFLDGHELVNTKPATVIAALQKVVGADKTRPLIIRADAMTPHQSVVTAMDAAAKLGMSRLSIATTNPSQ